MKNFTLLLLLLGVLSSCNSDDGSNSASENGLLGQWRLTAFYLDPGGGGGDFNLVNSGKIVAFHEDETYTSNGTLCTQSSTWDTPSSGTYSLEDSTYTPSNCDVQFTFRFEQNGNTLLLYYPCIEPCVEKYERQ